MSRSIQAPTLRQVLSGIGALALLAYGAYGVWFDDLVLPTKRSPIHLGGLSAWLMAAALLCVATHLVSVLAGGADVEPRVKRLKIVRLWAWRSAGVLAGASLWLNFAGVRFPHPNQLNGAGIGLGFLLFLVMAGLGWAQGRHERDGAALLAQAGAPGTGIKTSGTRVLALLLLMLGGLLVVLQGFLLIVNGHVASPTKATWGIAMTSVGAWLWLHARQSVKAETTSCRPSRNGTWLPLQIGAVLILCVWASASLDLSPRDTGEPSSAAAKQPGASRPMPELTLMPTEFRGQTKDALLAVLRAQGQRVRCYGDLKGRERIAPSITQVCVLNTMRTWGMPVEDVSFHFAGEALQMARYEFARDEWPNVRSWFFASEGQDLGTFGRDGDGNKISGRHVADGLLMTAPPPPRGTVMVLWEARSLLAERCGKNQMDPWQEAVLCPR